jgi:hypothetical protein
MGRLTTPITDDTLRGWDVLIAKIPTSRYAADEVEAIHRFVERGGGLMLVGEHTDVWGSGTYLNDIAERYGFRYRMDCLFGLDSTFEEQYRPPAAPHPIIRHMGPLDFAVSCSIAPGGSGGDAVIWNTGLRSAPADYHASNFYPQILIFPSRAMARLCSCGRRALAAGGWRPSPIRRSFPTSASSIRGNPS